MKQQMSSVCQENSIQLYIMSEGIILSVISKKYKILVNGVNN